VTRTAFAPLAVERSILLLRGERVMLDADIAALYGVETKLLIRGMRRNIARFPPDFASHRGGIRGFEDPIWYLKGRSRWAPVPAVRVH
jgi:hypothetical protein